jgi:hypothetical protein
MMPSSVSLKQNHPNPFNIDMDFHSKLIPLGKMKRWREYYNENVQYGK